VKILEGIYQLLTPFPQFSIEDAKAMRRQLEEHPRVTKGLPYVLPYLVKSNGDTMLIDCGWNTDSAYEALEAGMREHDSHPSEVARLFITHVHPDHFGMAGRLKRLADCEVLIHEKDGEFIKARYLAPKGLTDEMARFMAMNGVPPLDSPAMAQGSLMMLDKVAPVPPDRELKGGETLHVGSFYFVVIGTPGHSPGHICLYEPNRKVLFTGDHILPTITPNVSIHSQTHGSPLGDYMQSLEKLEHLDVEYVLPAHEFETKELKKRIREISAHHEERLQEMMHCVGDGGATAWEVAGRVKWATGMLSDFEPFMQRAAVGETLAHLEYLFEMGQLGKVMREKQLYWVRV
jgi:glyoxylase-like metal-dependent hydrolase (beta-lactamase superfamily II)